MNTKTLLALLLAVAALTVGCGGDFDPPSRINSLRPHALRATPPYLDPAPTAKTKLDALVVGATAGAELCHAWGLCAFPVNRNGTYSCAAPSLLVPLSTGPTAEINASHLAQLAAAAAKLAGSRGPNGQQVERRAPSTAFAGGLTVQFAVAEKSAMGGECPSDIRAFLDVGCTDPQKCVRGQKTLRLRSEGPLNPEITELDVRWQDGLANLTPSWNSSSETALFSWFTTAGVFAKERSFDDVPANALSLGDATRADVWVVVRDGQGGVGWAAAAVLKQ